MRRKSSLKNVLLGVIVFFLFGAVAFLGYAIQNQEDPLVLLRSMAFVETDTAEQTFDTDLIENDLLAQNQTTPTVAPTYSTSQEITPQVVTTATATLSATLAQTPTSSLTFTPTPTRALGITQSPTPVSSLPQAGVGSLMPVIVAGSAILMLSLMF